VSEISPKTRFYLEHRAQILEWARLENVAASDLHRWLSGWSEQMSEMPPEPDAVLWDASAGSGWAQLLWYRTAWQAAPGTPPIVGIGFEWSPNKPFGELSPFCGLRVEREVKGDPYAAIWAELSQRVSQSPALAGYRSSKWWPVQLGVDRGLLAAMTDGPLFAPEGSADPLPERMEAFRKHCFEAAYGLWGEMADVVDEVLSR
jgi:hypothetical protein